MQGNAECEHDFSQVGQNFNLCGRGCRYFAITVIIEVVFPELHCAAAENGSWAYLSWATFQKTLEKEGG